MSSFAEFLQQLLSQGEVVLRERPRHSHAEQGEARRVLTEAYADYRLDVAGPLIDFDAKTALAASELVRRACWFLVFRQESEAEVGRDLRMPGPPTSAAEHLSADLVLRFLPHVYRRARGLAPSDRLVKILEEVLRQWPLTGVLSDVAQEPTTSLDLSGHPGLMLLYAERLARKVKPAWVPRGRTLEYVELVFQEAGLPVTLPSREP